LSGPVFVAVQHEREKDRTPADWSAMQVHALPILGRGNNVIGADTYDGGGEDAGVKIRRMSAWTDRGRCEPAGHR